MNIVNNDELMHYGVLGMKWGVRKAENRAVDGSRVSKKLAKYKEAESEWTNSRNATKAARQKHRTQKTAESKAQYKNAKSKQRVARANLNKAYFKVKNADDWQKGKRLHAEGKTITDISQKQQWATLGLHVGGYLGSKALARSDRFVSNRSNLRYSDLAAVPFLTGMVANGAYYLHGERQKKKLRAYYYG